MYRRYHFYLPALFGVLAILALTVAAISAVRSSSAAPQGVATLQIDTNRPTDGTEPLPAGASIQTVLPNLTGGPVKMAFDPSGRLFYTEKITGNVRVYANGVLQTTPVYHVAAQSDGERGLLGIAIDPNFTTNHYIYIYWSCGAAGGCSNPFLQKVTRFVENNGVGSGGLAIWTATDDAGANNHNGGNIAFGADGKLYISIGDDGCCAANAQNVAVKNGKMHRINGDGTIPGDNPVFTQTGAIPGLYAMGLRNSFDFDFDPLIELSPYPRIFASENGPGCDDEMNRIEARYNYGWRESYPCDDPNPSPVYNTIAPLWFLPNGSCCEAPTGITFYRGTQIPQWTNQLFMATHNSASLRRFYLNAGHTLVTQTNVVQGVSVKGDLQTGPDGALYYFDQSPYDPSTNLKRIVGPLAATSTATRTRTPTGPTFTPSRTVTGTPPTSTNTATATATPSATACTLEFVDVPPMDTFYPFVHCLACQGYLGGYPCGGPGEPCNGHNDPYFRPGDNVSRGQIAKIVSNSAGFDDDILAGTQTFADVPGSNTFWLFVERLAKYGIMQGYVCGGPGEPCGTGNKPYFRVGAKATRGQIAKIACNAAGFSDTIPPGTQTFEDVAEGSTFHVFVERLLLNRPGVMQGYVCGGPGEPCGTGNRSYFRPGATASRGQLSKIVSSTFYPNCVVPVMVEIQGMNYFPDLLTIAEGTTVRFVNRDPDYHAVAQVEGGFETGILNSNQFADIIFGVPATYEYYDIPNPSMQGTIRVVSRRAAK